ncbi:MAG: Plasmid stabilization protein [Candidatus Brocadiaceae bacterium]|nr:Plasmid stabilization protein [Candidatus Brocadiaceae bacterium]
MMPVIFLPEVKQEMIEVSLYYQSQSPRLGVEFLSEVERAVKSIAASPNTWPILEGDLRRRLTKRC